MIPFQTDTFDPSDAQLLQQVQAGDRRTWLYLGATVYVVNGQRWVVCTRLVFRGASGGWTAHRSARRSGGGSDDWLNAVPQWSPT